MLSDKMFGGGHVQYFPNVQTTDGLLIRRFDIAVD